MGRLAFSKASLEQAPGVNLPTSRKPQRHQAFEAQASRSPCPESIEERELSSRIALPRS